MPFSAASFRLYFSERRPAPGGGWPLPLLVLLVPQFKGDLAGLLHIQMEMSDETVQLIYLDIGYLFRLNPVERLWAYAQNARHLLFGHPAALTHCLDVAAKHEKVVPFLHAWNTPFNFIPR